MHNLLKVSGIATVIAFAGFAPRAVAEDTKNICQDVGGFAAEPVGDREGHSISVDPYSCRVTSGPMSGGVETGTIIWEWDKTNAVEVSLGGVVRKPGAIVVYQGAEGKIALTMDDGKVTGCTASGRGRWVTATGTAASLAGKSFTWTSKCTGPGQFETEVKGE
jgi:hypothetical protein